MANATIYVATTGSDSTGDGSSGNPYATPGKAGSAITGSGNTIYIKAGTYTFTTSTANVAGGLLTPPAGASGAPNRVIGYNATVGDLDAVNDFSNFPILRGSASGPAYCLNFTNVECWAANLIFDGNSQATRGMGVTGQYCQATNCKAMAASSYGFLIDAAFFRAARLFATGCGYGLYCDSYCCSFHGCVATACTLSGIVSDAYSVTFLRCLSYANTGATVDGFRHTSTGGSSYFHCVSYGNGRAGIRLDGTSSADSAVIRNCILTGNGGYGLQSAVTTWSDGLSDYNAFYSNTSGSRSGMPTGAHDVTLTGDPFTNAAAGDFSLNNTAGAGAACRAVGFPGVFPGGTTTGYVDIGAAQHQDSGGGGTTVNYWIEG